MSIVNTIDPEGYKVLCARLELQQSIHVRSRQAGSISAIRRQLPIPLTDAQVLTIAASEPVLRGKWLIAWVCKETNLVSSLDGPWVKQEDAQARLKEKEERLHDRGGRPSLYGYFILMHVPEDPLETIGLLIAADGSLYDASGTKWASKEEYIVKGVLKLNRVCATTLRCVFETLERPMLSEATVAHELCLNLLERLGFISIGIRKHLRTIAGDQLYTYWKG